MDDLQLALLLIGGFIVGVIALSAYDRARIRSRLHETEARAEPERGPAPLSVADAPPPPPLLRPESRVLSSDVQPPTEVSVSPEQEFYRQLREIEDVAVMPLPRATGPRRAVQATPDPKIDFVINLPGGSPVLRDQALSIYRQYEYLLEKRRHIYGLRSGEGVWTNLERDDPDTKYTNLALALQLVDATGAVNESELNVFAQLALKLADSLGRPTKFAMTFEEAMARAAELKHFCDVYDVVASISLLPTSRSGFSGRAVESGALRFGLEFGARNIFHYKNSHVTGSPQLFSMANLFEPGTFDLSRLDAPIQGLSLFMHVPCVHQPVRAFEKMADTGQHLCGVLGGKMVDQERKPLSPQGLTVIRAQIETIAAEMQARDIAPGSTTAVRLFEVS